MKSLLILKSEPSIDLRVMSTLHYWRTLTAKRAPYRCVCGCPCSLANPCHCSGSCWPKGKPVA